MYWMAGLMQNTYLALQIGLVQSGLLPPSPSATTNDLTTARKPVIYPHHASPD